MTEAAADAAGRALGTLSYVRRVDGGYIMCDLEPESPPYVAVTPDDDVDTIMERLRRLA